MEALLMRILRPPDRDHISGDLMEEYRDALRDGRTRCSADIRYLRHILSVVLMELRRRTTARSFLASLCALSIAGMVWFAFVSSNPAVVPLAVVFAVQSVSTIALVTARRRFSALLLQPGAIVLVAGGALALVETLAWTVFEWCVALTGMSLVVQGVLTMALQLGWFGGFPSRLHER
jgi:hypothetical protein